MVEYVKLYFVSNIFKKYILKMGGVTICVVCFIRVNLYSYGYCPGG
jgi:hypothetical protein